jgi:hypothetical protein
MKLRGLAGPAVAVALAHAGCGDSTGPSPVEQTVSRTVGSGEAAAAATVSVRSGGNATVEVTADWKVAGNNFDIYVAANDCFDIPTALSAWSCVAVAKAVGETGPPEKVAFAGSAGATYKVFVLNHGPEPDTVTLTLSVR